MSASAVSITSSPARSTKGAGAEIRAAETPSARPIRICRGGMGWAAAYRKGEIAKHRSGEENRANAAEGGAGATHVVGRGGASSVRRSFVPSRPAPRAVPTRGRRSLAGASSSHAAMISPRPEVGVPLPARPPRNAALRDLAPRRGAVPAPTGRTGQRSGFPAQRRHPDEGQLHGHQSCVEKRSKGCSLYQKTSMISKSPPG